MTSADGNMGRLEKKARAVILAVLLLLVTPLSGCSAAGGHVRAVKQAVTAYTGCYFELTDLRGQMRAQSRGMTGYEDAASYTLDVRVPDYAQMNLADISYTVPAIDYAQADYEAYRQSLYDAIRHGADTRVMDGAASAYVDMQLTVGLVREDGRWHASITPESEQNLDAAVARMMAALCADEDALPQECRFVRIAEKKETLLASLLGSSAYASAFTVTEMEALGGGQYRMQLSYPAPENVFSALGKQYVDSFHERVFGSVDCRFDPDDYAAAAVSFTPDSTAAVTVSLSADGRCRVLDGHALSGAFRRARESAQATAGHAVNEKWGVQEVDSPTASTLLYGAGTGDAHFSVTLSAGMPPTYIRLIQVDSSIDETGVLQAGIFVLPDGKAFRAGFPSGTYKIVIAWGDTWYGPDYMFGPDGHYGVYEKTEHVGSGVTWRWWDLNDSWNSYRDIERCPYDVDISR